MVDPGAPGSARSSWTHVPSLGVSLHARVWDRPDAPDSPVPLVLVAGMGVSSRYWIPLGNRLGRHFHVLAPDLPGFGRSPLPPDTPWPGGPNVPEQSAQLLAWMNACGLHRVILCGHSSGCHTVAHFAARHPDRVEKLILLAPAFPAGQRRFWKQLPRLLLGGLFEMPALYPILAVEYGGAGLPRVAQQGLRMMAYPIEKDLPHIAAPTLVVRGARDPLVPRPWAQSLTALLQRGTLVGIERIGHAMQFSAPGVTAHTILGFVRDELAAPGTVVAPLDPGRRDPLGMPQPLPTWPGTSHLPMVAQANLGIVTGMALLFTAAMLKRRPRLRWSLAGLGFGQVLAGIFTAKPTGPATVRIASPLSASPRLSALQAQPWANVETAARAASARSALRR